VLFAAISLPLLGAGSALAQDDGSDIPNLPATYYGELEVTNGTLTGPVTIEAVADGEVQDSITTDATGQFGGPTISDTKVEVQPPEGGNVTFRVGDVVIETIPFESQTQQLNLSVPQSEVEAEFNVTDVESNTPVDGGETVTVDATVRNDGVLPETQDITLVNAGGETLNTTAVSLGYNESTAVSFTRTTELNTSINETFTVESADRTVPINITVERVTPPDIAPEPESPAAGGGGSSGGGGGGGGASPSTETETATEDTTATNGTPAETNGIDTPAGVEAVTAEQQTVVSDEGFGLSQVRFSEASRIISITWDTVEVAGDVSAVTLNTTAPETGPAPGALVSVSQVTAPANVTDTPATIQLRASTTRIDEVGATAENLHVYRFTDGEWQQLDTTIIEESAESVTLQAETPGLSYFAVSATGTPTAAIDAPTEVTAGETAMFNATNSTTQYGDVVAYEWAINDETYDTESVNATFEQAGNVTVELTVENDAGETNTTTETLTVTEASIGDSIPGFTVGLTVLVLLVTSLLARRRSR